MTDLFIVKEKDLASISLTWFCDSNLADAGCFLFLATNFTSPVIGIMPAIFRVMSL